MQGGIMMRRAAAEWLQKKGHGLLVVELKRETKGQKCTERNTGICWWKKQKK